MIISNIKVGQVIKMDNGSTAEVVELLREGGEVVAFNAQAKNGVFFFNQDSLDYGEVDCIIK